MTPSLLAQPRQQQFAKANHLSNRFPIKPQANTIAELSPNLEERVQGLGGAYFHSTENLAVAEAQTRSNLNERVQRLGGRIINQLKL